MTQFPEKSQSRDLNTASQSARVSCSTGNDYCCLLKRAWISTQFRSLRCFYIWLRGSANIRSPDEGANVNARRDTSNIVSKTNNLFVCKFFISLILFFKSTFPPSPLYRYAYIQPVEIFPIPNRKTVQKVRNCDGVGIRYLSKGLTFFLKRRIQFVRKSDKVIQTDFHNYHE